MTPDNARFDPLAFVQALTGMPGVYRMLGADGEVLYVGKAQNLKNRVASYFRESVHTPKTQALVAQIRGIEVTVTHTENEALILENNLIKQYKPRYNILLRDSKGYPYIFLSDTQDFPRIEIQRGNKSEKGRYFGPYPSVGAARESISLLQRLFRIRPCEDTVFNNRSRPCLQYQIRRCSGPCVGLIDREGYQETLRHVVMFLEGKNHEIIDELAERMERAAQTLQFERAAAYRDQIANLRRVQERQYVSGEKGDLDVIACIVRNGVACVQVFCIRDGRNLGNSSFFPRVPGAAEMGDILAAFLAQYYLTDGRVEKKLPGEILVNHALEEGALLEQTLSAQSGHKVSITSQVRGERARWLQMAIMNAEHAVVRQLASKGTLRRRLEALQEALGLDHIPLRLECFDISHTMGEAPVAACVVFDVNGPLKSDYRRFNIEAITPGDDYAAMHQALLRRYTRLKRGEGKLPDVLFIDGGKGQVTQAEAVLEELQITDVAIVGVAKGAERRPGLETLYSAGADTASPPLSASLSGAGAGIILPADSPALHLIQQIRDEAHRFAVTGHRQRRSKARRISTLEGIPGMGPRRRQQLLKQFGGLQEIARAGVEDLSRVRGISKEIAQRIYDTFHTE